MLPRSTCQGHFFSWREPIKTTWKLRLAALILLLVFAMHGVWISRLGQSLVCPEGIALSDLILVENFDPNFLVFERAAQLHHAGWASRVLVHTQVPHDPDQPDKRPALVSRGITELLACLAHLHDPEMIPIRAIEPISLNATYQIRNFLMQEQNTSLIVVTPGFRSQRSYLIYRAVLERAGITVFCLPVCKRSHSRSQTSL